MIIDPNPARTQRPALPFAMPGFYDDLTPLYHLIHQDWNASIAQQGMQLSAIIESEWPGRRQVLDVCCGIGTQAIALGLQGYSVTGSDLSAPAVARAAAEARQRGVEAAWSVCDMRQAHAHHGGGFEVVICCDNSLPHLLTDDELLLALKEMLACLAPGGGCLITVRDYALEPRGSHLVKPYGTRLQGNLRYLLFQVWDFDRAGEANGGSSYGDHYALSFFFVQENLSTGAVETRAMRSRYYAIPTARLCDLMREAGFRDVRRIDDVFYQPVLVGSKAGA